MAAQKPNEALRLPLRAGVTQITPCRNTCSITHTSPNIFYLSPFQNTTCEIKQLSLKLREGITVICTRWQCCHTSQSFVCLETQFTTNINFFFLCSCSLPGTNPWILLSLPSQVLSTRWSHFSSLCPHAVDSLLRNNLPPSFIY